MVPPRAPKRKEGTGNGRMRRPPVSWLVGVMVAAVALSAVLIAVSMATRSSDEDGHGGVDPTAAATRHLCASGSLPVDGRKCGLDAAPVKIVEFSDYQCPFCRRFVDVTEPGLESEYIQKGLVQLEFHNLAITAGNAPPDKNEATLAAEAAECANDQGRFWEYHYRLYAEQQGENRGAFLPERLKQFATDLGLDRGEFDACLDSHKHIDLIDGERDEAAEAGVRATPSFLLNGKLVVGYAPFDDFRIHIEEVLVESELR
jgi:protein-disulfide isomerase